MQMHEIFYVIPLYGLTIKSSLGSGDKLDAETFISNDLTCINNELTAEWGEQFGRIDTSIISNCTAFVYGRSKLNHPDADYRGFLEERLHYIGQFLSTLWMVKDNAVNMGFGYLRARLDKLHRTYEGLQLSQIVTMADGCRPEECPTILDRDTLREARELFRRFTTNPKKGEDVKTRLHKSINPTRIQRAHYFLQASRSTSDVGIKIALYCTALEALFGTDKQELTHRLSERVAVYAGGVDQRLGVYQDMKRAYNVRSGVLHGASIQKAYDGIKVEDISRRCDQLLRVCLIRSLNDDLFNKPNSEINKYFLERIFLGG